MRGEETQLLGALAQVPALAEGRQLVCLPGTHTKWVSLHDGVVLEFLTVPTGELFGLLCDHSVLVRDRRRPSNIAAPSSSAGSPKPRGTRGVRCCTGCSRPAACASTSS